VSLLARERRLPRPAGRAVTSTAYRGARRLRRLPSSGTSHVKRSRFPDRTACRDREALLIPELSPGPADAGLNRLEANGIDASQPRGSDERAGHVRFANAGSRSDDEDCRHVRQSSSRSSVG
jgi:hypothetical protein